MPQRDKGEKGIRHDSTLKPEDGTLKPEKNKQKI